MTTIVVIAHNIRSIHNVGSIFRTCEGMGVKKLILSGYTPYPALSIDTRLPHIKARMTQQIHKTALGTEEVVPFDYETNLDDRLKKLKSYGYEVVGLEQDKASIDISKYSAPKKIVLLLGEELYGITSHLKQLCDVLVEIPMLGKKESYNVSVAAGIALFAVQHR